MQKEGAKLVNTGHDFRVITSTRTGHRNNNCEYVKKPAKYDEDGGWDPLRADSAGKTFEQMSAGTKQKLAIFSELVDALQEIALEDRYTEIMLHDRRKIMLPNPDYRPQLTAKNILDKYQLWNEGSQWEPTLKK